MTVFRVIPLLLAAPLLAHTYAVSHGTLQVVPGGARLTLRLSNHHFHPALEAFAGRRIVPKDGEAYPVALLQAYFAGRLELVAPGGEVLPFTVVQQALDPKDLVVTLEVVAPSLQGHSLRHTVLQEASPKQLNLLTVEGLGARRGLTFDRKHPVLPLEGP